MDRQQGEKMSRSRLKTIAIVFLILLLCTGCWDSQDNTIEKTNIVSMCIVDDEKGNCNTYYEIVDLTNKTGTDVATVKSSYLQATGKTYVDAWIDFERRSDHLPFLGAARILAFGKGLSQKGIQDFMIWMSGKEDFRKGIKVVYTQSQSEKMLKIKTENDLNVGAAIEDCLKYNNNLGTGMPITADDILQGIADHQSNFLLPQMDVIKSQNTFVGFAVFKDGRYKGTIEYEKMQGTIFLLGKGAEYFYPVTLKQKSMQVIVECASKKVTPKLVGNDLYFNINLSFDMNVHFISDYFTLTPQEMMQATQILKKQIQKDVEDAIVLAQQKYQCDYLQFYKYFRSKYQQQFKKGDWAKRFIGAKMKVTINGEIQDTRIMNLEGN